MSGFLRKEMRIFMSSVEFAPADTVVVVSSFAATGRFRLLDPISTCSCGRFTMKELSTLEIFEPSVMGRVSTRTESASLRL